MSELWRDLDIIFRKNTPKYNFKMSEDKLVPSKATKSALGECFDYILIDYWYIRFAIY